MNFNSFKSVLALFLFALFLGNSYAQNSLSEVKPVFNEASFSSAIAVDDLLEVDNMNSLEDEVVTLDYYEEEQMDPVEAVFAVSMLGLTAGLGLLDGETLWCLGVAYYYRLALMTNTALYAALAVLYSGLSTDPYNQNLFQVAANLLWFTAITMYKQVHLVYGLAAAYAFGTQKYDDGFKYDITRFTASLVLGLNVILSARWSVLLTTSVLTYLSDKLEYEGNEIKDDTTFALINKGNIFAVTLVYALGTSRWRNQ